MMIRSFDILFPFAIISGCVYVVCSIYFGRSIHYLGVDIMRVVSTDNSTGAQCGTWLMRENRTVPALRIVSAALSSVHALIFFAV